MATAVEVSWNDWSVIDDFTNYDQVTVAGQMTVNGGVDFTNEKGASVNTSELKVSGLFYNLGSASGSRLEIANGGVFQNASGAGSVTQFGTVLVGDNAEIKNEAQFIVDGTLLGTGTLSNEASGYLVVDTITSQDHFLLVNSALDDQTGSVIVKQDASIYQLQNDGNMTVGGDLTLGGTETSSNNGTLTVTGNVSVTDNLSNDGQLTAGQDLVLGKFANVTNNGTLSINGNLTMAEGAADGNGVLHNFKTVNFGASSVMGADFFINESGASTTASALTVTGAYLNYGLTEGETLLLDEGGSYENKTSGHAWAQFGTVTIFDGSMTNEAGAQLVVTDTLTGTGSFENHGTFMAGSIVGNNGFAFVNEGEDAEAHVSGNAEFDSLTNGGLLLVDGDMTAFGQGTAANSGEIQVGGTLTVEKFSNANGATVNADALTVNQVYTNDGETTGTMLTVSQEGAYTNTSGSGAVSQFGSATVYGSIANEGQFIVDGTLTGTGSFDNQNLLVAGSVVANNGFAFANGAAATAQINGSADFDLLDNQGVLNVGGDMSLFGNGEAKNANALTVGGTFTVSDKTFVNNGSVSADALTTVNGGAVRNEGTISVNSALDGVDYTEAGATADIHFGDDQITNSTVTLLDGAVWAHALGTGNAYTVASSLDGQPSLDGGLLAPEDWKADRSQIIAQEVTGENTFNVQKGGVLSFNVLGEAGDNAGFIKLDGGALQTSLDQVFDGVAYVDGDERIEGEDVGTVFGATEVAGVSDAASSAIEAQDGYLVFDDEVYSSNVVTSIDAALKQQQGEGWTDLTVRFTGKDVSGEVTDINWANRITNSTDRTYVFDNVRLIANYLPEKEVDGAFSLGKYDVNPLLVMNGSALGVGAIVGTDYVQLENGAHLTLVGFGEDEQMAGDEFGSGTVMADASTLSFAGNAGWVQNVELSNASALDVSDGSYGVGSLTMDESSALQVAGSAVFRADSVTGGNVDNDGFLQLGAVDALRVTNTNTLYVTEGLKAEDGIDNQSGTITVGGAVEAGGIINAGNLYAGTGITAVAVENADAGFIQTSGSLTAGMLENSGTVYAGSFDAQAVENAGKITVVNGATLGSFSQSDADASFTAGDGTVLEGAATVTGGEFALGSTTFASGSSLTVAGAEGTDLEASLTLANNELNGRINVSNATVTLGAADGEESAVAAEGYTSALVLNQTVTIGEGGSLAVGSDAANQNLGNGDVWFGGDSFLKVNTLALADGNGVVTSGVEGASFTVEDGAQIQLDTSSIGWGSYKLVTIAKDFESANAGGWLNGDNVTVSGVGSEDIDANVTVDENGDVILTVGSEDIAGKLPNVAVPNLINEIISNPDGRPTSGGSGFLAAAIENGNWASTGLTGQALTDLQTQTINDTAQIMAAGGVLVQGMTLVGNAMDITDRHLSYEDVHFKNGQLQKWDGVRFWVDALGQRVDASGYDFSGGEAKFDGYNAGFIFGADLMAPCGARYGAAFAYQNANIDSNGSAVKTSNEADAYTFTLYAAKDVGHFNFIGSASYTRIDSDLEQSLPAGFGKHTLDVSNDVFTFGLKGEYNITLSKSVQAVPYVGVRAVWMDTSDEKSKLGGASAFDYETDSVTQVQFPIGVAFQGTMDSGSGWTSRGVIDLSVTPVAGDKDVDTTIRANGLSAKDVVNTEFSDDLTGAIRIGVMAEKDAFAFGGNLGFSTGGDRDGNVTFGLNARYRF